MNFLKRLELQGFKSFAGKMILDFPAKIVGVVGPNGSGKSNIIDALRWALGEREAKHLRGETLDNLIFAGSEKKAATGLARVSLYFDNSERKFPIDAEEIVVSRKIDRSGVSEFLINDAEIKLKDLVPMLARVKLGSRGMTIVGQGQSDIFVRSTPEERREMIEEILGLREFRLKKHQAERRLETSGINLEKVKAMVEELAPHLRLLRRQKSRFEKRSEIAGSLKQTEDEYFGFHYGNVSAALESSDIPVKEIIAAQKKKEAEIKDLEAKIKEIDRQSSSSAKIKELRNNLLKFVDRKFELEKELGRIEAKMEFQRAAPATGVSFEELERNVKDFTLNLEEMLGWDSLERLKKELQNWLERLKRIFNKKAGEPDAELQNRQTVLKKELSEIDDGIKELRAEEEKFAEEQDIFNKEFRTRVEELEAGKNELRDLEHKLQNHFLERQRLELKLGELTREWRSYGREAAELKNLPRTESEIDSAALDKKMVRLRGELAAIGEIDEGLMKEATEAQERYEFLTRESGDLEKAIHDLKNLIKDLDGKIHTSFKSSFKQINEEFNNYFRLMFGGGKAKLKLEVYKPKAEENNAEEAVLEEGELKPEKIAEPEENQELRAGIEIDLSVPRKGIKGIDMLSGGERSLVSLAALFALIAVSSPPFLVLDEIDAALDEENARRFAELIKEFSKKTQFVLVTHNRATMEAADILYGVTMGEDGVSKVLSLKLEG
ncbi:MAG: Chromosome partition protein Smc [Candidatus Jorgensenbacteria bacterium GW2011_GWA1_48_13]|uniref:Chromosome partition protein Smc n=2 Tax=Candidatus Joergenseniibacteriota TaxID=1752739 RepID=A0A0G1W8I6_9BACT|nr:MAG: Chromosome partition protein Smc [Candidatus Jorgensenbacteria bacterium GW2011_GWA1_48_13]KKU97963.1 MAG: Chromosome partition protein Smc [Candidatus Jorgensenbacteria bacterium GW2011_GWC1_48_8]KKW15033.1 MAG: Chromosome partition protein Smc [Candidatus Jorgensenbacteria bacterium GW2011_GWB1_50_10]